MTEHEITMRRHYAMTALARMGIEYERGMEIAAVRIVVEVAASAEEMRTKSAEQMLAAA